MSDLPRRSFLVTTTGWVLGNIDLPALSPAQVAAKKRMFNIPVTGPNAFISWLELDSTGDCRCMVFMALSDGDRKMIKGLTDALAKKDFRLERLAQAPHKDGEFVVRLAVAGEVRFLTTGDEKLLFSPDPEEEIEIFTEDPNQAATFTYARALLLAVRLMREMQAGQDTVVYMEPVQKELAVSDPDDIGIIFVDYLPTIDPNQPGTSGPGVPPGGRAATVYLVAGREED